jgi:regulation of enolase protein 1 (concanavalin A-like superfamily)
MYTAIASLVVIVFFVGTRHWWLEGGRLAHTSAGSVEFIAAEPPPRGGRGSVVSPSVSAPVVGSVASVPAPASAAEPMVAFANWLLLYTQASKETQDRMAEEGVRLAEARRPVFKKLIQDDPRRALQESVPPLERDKLPPMLQEFLEQPVNAHGVMRVYQAGPESLALGQPTVLRYVETPQGETYRTYVFGRRAASMEWVPNLSVIGVQIDNQLALDERPLRVLEVGERVPEGVPRKAVCPISKIETLLGPESDPIQVETPAVLAHGEVVYLCDGSHATLYEQLLIQGESSSGGAQSFTGILPSAPTPSVGVVKVLFIPAVFPDEGQVPITEAGAYDMMRQAADFYQANSFGRLTLVATVTPPVMLPRNRVWYAGKDNTSGYIKEIDGLSFEMSHAKDAARRAGYDWTDYHATVVRASGGARAPTSFGGGGNVWMREDSVKTATHEIGHAFGLEHANYWETNGASVIGPGGNVEYGDSYDNMGGGTPPNGHYNVQAKNQIKWLPDEFAPPITSSGSYRIFAMDQPRLDPGKRYGLRIKKDNERTYWGEYRLLGGNNWSSNGMLLGWRWPNNSGVNLQLLDTTPGSLNAKSDAGITVGRTFSDRENGIHVTTVAVNTSTTPASLDVVVNLGDFSGNQSPSLVLTPTSVVVPTNTPVTFSASATDPEGDALSYSWQWHDTVISGNTPTVTRTFSTSGVYTMNCVVSDMKGGVTVRNAVITVGNGNGKFTISGRITRQGVGVPNISVTTGGTNGTVTDSDGNYVISNLAAGSYTVTPASHGCVFSELFNNTISVGPSCGGADFAIDDLPAVAIAAKTPVAVEGGVSGAFRITRTGPTSVPLTVFVFTVQGTATKGTSTTNDYFFSPDYVSASPYQSFTIPADTDFLDVVVPARNDGASEGDENVTLVLAADTSYVLGSQNRATITIQDANSVLPRVSLTASAEQTNENTGVPVVLTFTRTGSTSSSLDVPYSLASTSTATSGVDYVTLAGTVTIPANQASATVAISPLDDAVAEATETVSAVIGTNAAFIADAGANNVTVRIIDDDAQTVTIAATDSAAREVDRAAISAVPDPGTLIVTRSGSTAAPLTVYYGVSGTALHGTDYDALPGNVIIPAGQTQAAINIMPRFDGFGEGAETVVVALGAGFGFYQLGATASATVTIADNSGDKPVIEVTSNPSPTSAPFTAAEPSTTGTFRITAKGGSGSLVVQYTVSGTATPGGDYTVPGLNAGTLAGTATLTLNGGTVTQTLTVTPVNDAFIEPVETVILTLTPSANYSLWQPLASATMLLRDDDQPTVFVDAQVGTGSTDSVSENSTGTTNKFFVSRTGSTASALTVNYSLGGTATPGVDYTNASLAGTVTIPAGSAGVDISFNTINDTTAEGMESVVFHLEPGEYAASADATLYILDDEGNTQSVAFPTSGGAGPETVTSVEIPVTLNAPAVSPVSVEYSLEAGARTPTFQPGTWVRVVRTGNSFVTSTSPDGTNWTAQSSPRAITMSSTSYLAGFCVTSGSNTTRALATIDSVGITGLSAGGSSGAMVNADIGPVSPAGGNQASGGVHQVTAGGADIAAGTADAFRYVYFPVTNSADCTIIARVVNFTGTANVKAGVMIRESTAAGSQHASMLTNYSATSGWAPTQVYRATANAAATSVGSAQSVYSKPRWLRLERAGDLFTASLSSDGTSFAALGAGQKLPLSSQLLVGMAVSSRTDGQLAQATFDNVSISPAPNFSLQDRTVGFVDAQGASTQSAGTYVVNGSGSGIMNSNSATEDEAHFLSVPVTGDFQLTTRLTAVSASNTAAQAGLMVRESTNYRARAVWFGLTAAGSSTPEWRARLSATESGEGYGIDYVLPPGVLSFAVGEQTKNIVLSVTNDSVIEPMEFVNVVLKNPTGAVIGGGGGTYTYTIVDDDVASALPVAGFAAATAAGLEATTTVQVPVVLSEPAAADVTLAYGITAGTASSGIDFTEASGTVTFSAGQTLVYLPLALLDDAAVEGPETVQITLSSPAGCVLGTNLGYTFTITDDDTPLVSVTANDPTAAENGDSGEFTFTRTGPTTGALTVNFTRSGTATSGSDYGAIGSPGTVTIPSGQDSATLLVVPLNDATSETPETVIVTLATGTGYTEGSSSAATVTINDDDVNTVTLVASDGTASESGNDGGELILTRTGPTSASLTVTIAISGTATAGGDFASIPTTQTFGIGVSSVVIPVVVSQDAVTEGREEIVVSIASSVNYMVGTPSVANITIVDDDLPPSVFISSPASKSTIIDPANGLFLEASGADDGLPSSLTYSWTQLFGPGTTHFDSPASASTTATFSAPGVYGLRVTVNDGQFSASDDVFVQNAGFGRATWVSQDQGPPSKRGISGESNGVFQLIGSGTGYTSASDSGHMLFRQIFTTNGDATITARLSSLTGPGAQLAGITLRDTSWKSARRVNLMLDATGNVQFNNRTTPNTVPVASVTASGLGAPVWLRLQRVGGTITASHAPDVGGAPGGFVNDGTSTITTSNNVIVGMVVSAGAGTVATGTAVFDNVSVTPAFVGPAQHSEDIGNSPLAGSSTESAGAVNVTAYGFYDTAGGHFRYQQIWGDCIVTAFLSNHNGSFRGAQSGVGLRDTTDDGAHAFYGNTSVDGYQVHWRSIPGGSGGVLQSAGTGWIRLVRKRNTVVAYKAPNVNGAPGTWTLNSGNIPVVATGPLLVGMVVDSASNTGAAVGTFTSFSVEPLNTAPVVRPSVSGTFAPFTLNAGVVDDGNPAPPSATTVAWSQLGGPGSVAFGNRSAASTMATLSSGGDYILRVSAYDGDAATFGDLSFTGWRSSFERWQRDTFGNINAAEAAAEADPDKDGLPNLLEYAMSLDGNDPSPNPLVSELLTSGADRFLCLTVPRNPAATDVTFSIEATSDLSAPESWSTSGIVFLENNATRLQARDSVAIEAGTRRFMRVRVTRY